MSIRFFFGRSPPSYVLVADHMLLSQRSNILRHLSKSDKLIGKAKWKVRREFCPKVVSYRCFVYTYLVCRSEVFFAKCELFSRGNPYWTWSLLLQLPRRICNSKWALYIYICIRVYEVVYLHVYMDIENYRRAFPVSK